MSKFSLGQLAELVDGELVGDANLEITDAATLQQAKPTDISFADSTKALPLVETTAASAVIVDRELPVANISAIRVDNVRAAFATIVKQFRPPIHHTNCGISELANVSGSAKIGSDVNIHPGANIGPDVEIGDGTTVHASVTVMPGCKIGERTTLFPGVVLYENTRVGSNVVLHANSVIGAYGFGYDTVRGEHMRGDQLGNVIIEDDVEIGANTTIDRGTYGPTIIGKGTKVDNLVQIAHNCRIGKHNLICSQVGIAGTSSTGDYVVMAGQVGVPDHVTVGDRVILGAKSGIMRDVPSDMTMLGIPATPEREQMAKQAAFAKLPEMRKQLRRLQKIVDELVAINTGSEDSVPQSEAA
ncbi:MAG: UDP-3-O-(3-hydroxymyristoyl)glucosamine N-acyltransferase [Planctomycetales bacterium]|nr:UDP-3-O-(3-hydroxymyristoyl)glucosamine N-acyltransferase [Planctomycetales bacterium]